ncbi:MAG: hypothetical protein WDN28_29785 [Chthoniobacter sp.]
MKRLLLVGLALFFAGHAFAAAERWNILFIFADDWGRYASCYQGLDGRPTLNGRGEDAEYRSHGSRGRAVQERVCQCAELHAVPQLAALRKILLQLRSRCDP